MKPTVQAARAITGTTFQRIFKPVAWLITAVLAIVYTLIIIASIKISLWWLVFLIILVPFTLIALVLGWLLWQIASRITPRKLNKTEKFQINQFVDSLLGIWEIKSTPMPIVAFMIGKDLLRRRNSTYIDSIVNNSQSLKTNFSQIAKLFE